MHPVQAMIDALSDAARLARSSHHLTLGEAIEALAALDPEAIVRCDNGDLPGPLNSYRGYYSDLAFQPINQAPSVAVVLADARAALDSTFEGYKGGDFLMRANTPLWVSGYGAASGIAVTDITAGDDGVVFHTRVVD